MIFIDPAAIRLERQENQPPTLILSGDRYLDIRIRQAFPLTAENVFVAFFDQEDQYLGIIMDPADLDGHSTQIINEEISWRYFIPQITQIKEIHDRGGKAIFVAVTDRGQLNISMRDLRASMVELSPNRILITDEYSNRYEIPDVDRLDRHSRRLIRRLI
ncbi:MAG TPA: hypothetical protein DIT99_18770 [Candidatus Latescibacteria bacterium]|nr:hypothetical protein [Candidatus Latescibacterota bacterium]